MANRPVKIMFLKSPLFIENILPPTALVKKACFNTIKPMRTVEHFLRSTLRKSEGLFKIDMIYAAKGGFWTTIRFGIGVVGSLATMIAFGNLLPRENYGVYNYLLSLGSSLAFLTLSGTGIAVIRAVARGYENIIPAALKLQLRYNLFALATIASVGSYYLYKGNYVFGISLFLLAVAYPFSEAFHIYEQVLTGKKRFDLLAKINGLTMLLASFSMVATLFFTDDVLVIISVFAFMNLVPNMLAYRFAVKDIDSSEPKSEIVSEMRRTSFHLTGAGLIGVIAAYIDKILLFQVAGPVTLAVYGFAIAGPERLKGLIKSWISIALPSLAERSTQEIKSVFYKRVLLALAMGGAVAAVYIIFSPYLFQLLLPKYLDAILYSRFYALGLIFVPVTVYIGSIFTSQNMLKATYAQGIGSQILRIALFSLFCYLWQIWGLVAASILANLLSSFYSVLIWEIESRRIIKKNA
jgi:O-antigen/teichoic acid export membrane protein